MNRNYLIGFGAFAAVLCTLAFAGWYFFEIEPRTKPVFPSREARINEFLALDRFLLDSGISVRTTNEGNISLISVAKEKQIFLQASLFRWDNESAEYLFR